VFGGGRHGGERAEPERAVLADLDAVVEAGGPRREVHEAGRAAHVLLQELDHVRPAGDVLGGRIVAPGLRAERDDCGDAVWPFEREGLHASGPP
jgi:hypothetical protein